MKGALLNVTIVTLNKAREVIQNGGLVWENGRLSYVGESAGAQQFAQRRGITWEEGRGKLVFPGLINTHMHLFQNLLKGLGSDRPLENWWPEVIAPAAVKIREKHLAAAVKAGALEAVRSGTTTLVDYMYAHPVAALSDVEIDSLRQVGVRTVYGRGFRNTGADIGFPQELIEKMEDVFDDILRLRKEYEKESDGMVKIWLAPAAAWALTVEGLRQTREFADAYRIPVTMHMFETETDNVICQKRYNKTALDYFEEAGLLGPDLLAVHTVKVRERELRAFKAYGVKVSHNPVSNMYLASGVAPVPEMLQADLTIGLGTDGAASNNCLDMLETMKITALLHKVYWNDPTIITAQKVLEMATIDAAKSIGLDEEIGSLETGKKADFFVYSSSRDPNSCPCHDPVATLVYSSGNAGVEKVVINGETILHESEFVRVDERKTMAEQQEMAEDLVRLADYSCLLNRGWKSFIW